MKKVLLYRFSAIGDVIMLLPSIKGCLASNPEVEIYLVSGPFFAPIFEGIDRLHFIPTDIKKNYKGFSGLFRLYRKLQKEIEPDVILDMHQVLRTNALNLFFSIFSFKKVYKINKGRAEKKRIVKSKQTRKIASTNERYKQVFEQAKLKAELPNPPLLPTNVSSKELDLFFEKHNLSSYKLVGIAPFSAHPQKMWGIGKFNQLIADLEKMDNVKVLLFGGGKDELEQLNELSSNFRNSIVVGNELSFKDELKLIPKLSAMVSMDSANMHLAAMAGIATISIWGATHPSLGFAPYMQEEKNIIQYEGKEINCRPCAVYGNKECLYGSELPCMRLIKVESVLQRLTDLLS